MNTETEETLNKIEDYFGFVPKIFQVMSDKPEFLNAFQHTADALIHDDALPPLTKEFILIGAAASIGGEHCLKTHLSVAKELGATEEQLLSATLLGSFIAETKTLTKSLRVFYDIKE